MKKEKNRVIAETVKDCYELDCQRVYLSANVCDNIITRNGKRILVAPCVVEINDEDGRVIKLNPPQRRFLINTLNNYKANLEYCEEYLPFKKDVVKINMMQANAILEKLK